MHQALCIFTTNAYAICLYIQDPFSTYRTSEWRTGCPTRLVPNNKLQAVLDLQEECVCCRCVLLWPSRRDVLFLCPCRPWSMSPPVGICREAPHPIQISAVLQCERPTAILGVRCSRHASPAALACTSRCLAVSAALVCSSCDRSA